MLSNIFLDFISDMGVTDHRHCIIDNTENKIESLHLQQCSLKNSLVILAEASFFTVNVYIYLYRGDIKEITSVPV